ncbi:2-succinyl-6-hydroxy-2,4-cyclohexadiene-1-carboxy late synthase [Sphaerisporangium melleum]|uniref:2-succinyl-6-hydroxy-2, 4-cyclohexadiene-1-carboxylate synthase n=1 Tax=Sphaerisporangium melleum TaxID=321316 RepID=A0A917QY26_9ACTN|nr:alpha/beta hydrolase [Sphaerisporangium melleum]GGK75731.1 2-succinyl-6-hydroxy-2,4-cyclohexadiene-1-carboxylate synthase [Sphaerisporangium melleum]GII72665.1 2-succinyl-6-hydroxy-2,4-cyclohexadiene-1-carboxy late synthase [Sphaerisporangium melleum]
MAIAYVNGRHLGYSDTGGDGHPVILGHGYFTDHSVFAAQAEALHPRWRVIAWDARGHGATADDGEPCTYWDQARDVLGLMDHLGLPRATVGGISQGGFIALRTALLAPERVSALILSDTEATPCDPADKAGYGQMFAALAEHGPIDDLLIPLSRQIIGDDPHADEWRERWKHVVLPLGAAAGCLLERDDVSDRLAEITCPVLLMWGSEDRSLPRDRMDLLAERLPAATPVRVISGAAHTPALTHPAEVNRVLLEFLSTSASSAAA